MKKKITGWIAALLLLLLLTCTAYADSTIPSSVAAYNGKRIGVLTGTLMEGIAKETFPDSEYLYFNNYPDCITALLSNKIDAFLGDEPGLKTIHAEQPDVDFIRDRITNQEYSFAFRKNDPKSADLCAELNTFLAKCRRDGTIQELEDIWFGVDEDRKVVDMSDLTGKNGTIKVITTSTDMPFSYIKNNRNVGYDIDLVVRFCRDRGYQLELGDVDFSGRIPAINSGKYDFTTDMNVTPERAEEVLFSDATSTGGVVLAVKSEDLAEAAAAGSDTAKVGNDSAGDARSGIVASFYKTFIREDRWQLFVKGLMTTLLVTLMSLLSGTLLGFAVFMLCRNGNPVTNLITRVCLWLLQGMPMVVLLMILYYIIFGSVNISGIAVAVIGFTLTFGSAVFGLLKMGMVFQSFNLFGHRTVIENIMMAPMDLLGKSKQEAYDTGMHLLRSVGLAEKALNYPDELSGGQKQRIAIARTLAMDPDVILMDEPTSALDPTMVGEVQAVIRDLARRNTGGSSAKTMMIVTHEMAFARAISNRVFYLDEGGIYEQGTPGQIFDKPQREKTRRFIRRLKVLELNIESRDYDFLGMAAQIDRYCNKNQIPPKQASHLQLAFEELVQQMLIPVLESPRIQVVIEYAETDQRATMTVRYNGPQYDILENGDDLSRSLLMGITADISFETVAVDDFSNCLTLVFAEE